MAKLSTKEKLGKLFGKGQKETTQSDETASLSQSATLQSPGVKNADNGTLNLVQFSPEDLMLHVEQEISRVQFGWTRTTKWMEGFSEFWSWMGPIILLAGTIGEVFLVLWLRQKDQSIPAGLSIVAVALVLEGTFLTISYKAATIRNRAEKRPGGPSDLDKLKMKRQFFFWFALALGVCATQVLFVVAQTRGNDIGTYGVWAFAILRSVFTLVADGYTAFAHEERPTTAERALEEQQQRAAIAKKMLHQKGEEVDIMNDGISSLRRKHMTSIIDDESLRTDLEMKRIENQNRVTTLRAQAEQAAIFATMQNNMMRSLFDPSMDEGDRDRMLGTLHGFMGAMKQLPSARVEQIEEGDL